jgi:hypothetical protein
MAYAQSHRLGCFVLLPDSVLCGEFAKWPDLSLDARRFGHAGHQCAVSTGARDLATVKLRACSKRPHFAPQLGRARTSGVGRGSGVSSAGLACLSDSQPDGSQLERSLAARESASGSGYGRNPWRSGSLPAPSPRCGHRTGQTVKSRKARRTTVPAICSSASFSSRICPRESSSACSSGWNFVPTG